MVEVAPPFDPSGATALVGATMMFEMLWVLADAVARRKGWRRLSSGRAPGPAQPSEIFKNGVRHYFRSLYLQDN